MPEFTEEERDAIKEHKKKSCRVDVICRLSLVERALRDAADAVENERRYLEDNPDDTNGLHYSLIATFAEVAEVMRTALLENTLYLIARIAQVEAECK